MQVDAQTLNLGDAYAQRICPARDLKRESAIPGRIQYSSQKMDHATATRIVADRLGKQPCEEYQDGEERQSLWYLSADQSRRVCVAENYWGGIRLMLIDLDAMP